MSDLSWLPFDPGLVALLLAAIFKRVFGVSSMEEIAPLILPFLSLLVTVMVIFALYAWWSSYEGQASQPFQDSSPSYFAGTSSPQPTVISEPSAAPADAQDKEQRDGELTVGQLFDNVSTRLQAFAAGFGRSGRSGNSQSQTGSPALGGTFNFASSGVPDSTSEGNPGLPAAGYYSGRSADTIEVLRVLRDLADGSLIVEIDGKRYLSVRDFTDPQIGRRFVGTVQALNAFIKAKDAPPSQVSTTQEAQTGEPLAVPPVAPPPYSAQPPEPPPPPSFPSASPAPEFPPLPEVNPVMALFRNPAKDLPKFEVTERKSMAEEIEELLQYRLTLTPELRLRSLHVRPSLDGGVQIDLDGQIFDGVGSVTDLQVQEFLRSVIQEWENRQ